MLDIANPGWYVRDYKEHGLALRADYKMLRNKDGAVIETAQDYWDRVRKEIMTEVNTEVNEELIPADQADAAIAEAFKKGLEQADLPEVDSDGDEDEQPRPF